MEKIVKLWFEEGRVCILTDADREYSRPLEAFPLLLDATAEQRAKYEIGMDGDDVHWDEIDEDIQISSFFVNDEPNMNNPVADLFKRFQWLDVAEVAQLLGIHKSLLSKYIYGIKKPSEQRIEQIVGVIRQMGCEMASI